MTQFEPTASRERLHVLDVLRGVALLGILMMNIPYFAMPFAAYANLNLWGGSDGANLWGFLVQWTLFEGKMRAIFSLLFGVGIILFIQHASARRDSVAVGDLFARRMLWLLLFGVLHAWFIWYGDILYPYALVGLMLFAWRTMRPKTLFTIAAAGIVLLAAGAFGFGFSLREQREAALAAQAVEAKGGTLTDEQQEAKESWEEIRKQNLPTRAEMQKEIDAYRGGYASAMEQRASVVSKFHFLPVYFPVFFDFAAMMLIGMAFYKLGIIQGERPVGFYARFAAVGYAIGLPLEAASAGMMYAWNFDLAGNAFASAPHQIGRVAVALAHVAVVIVAVQRGWLTALTDRLASVGRMAFSNYISHSVICSLIFYSPGLALMGQVQRYQLYYFVAGIWAFNLLWSHWWLTRYHFGPLEWCWRSLTYWQRQPMRRAPPAPAPVSV